MHRSSKYFQRALWGSPNPAAYFLNESTPRAKRGARGHWTISPVLGCKKGCQVDRLGRVDGAMVVLVPPRPKTSQLMVGRRRKASWGQSVPKQRDLTARRARSFFRTLLGRCYDVVRSAEGTVILAELGGAEIAQAGCGLIWSWARWATSPQYPCSGSASLADHQRQKGIQAWQAQMTDGLKQPRMDRLLLLRG
jgi:hypothetical protein